jgi:hypothetical protein
MSRAYSQLDHLGLFSSLILYRKLREAFKTREGTSGDKYAVARLNHFTHLPLQFALF